MLQLAATVLPQSVWQRSRSFPVAPSPYQPPNAASFSVAPSTYQPQHAAAAQSPATFSRRALLSGLGAAAMTSGLAPSARADEDDVSEEGSDDVPMLSSTSGMKRASKPSEAPRKTFTEAEARFAYAGAWLVRRRRAPHQLPGRGVTGAPGSDEPARHALAAQTLSRAAAAWGLSSS